MTLLSILSALDPVRVALVLPQGVRRYGFLCEKARGLAPSMVGARLALVSEDVDAAITAMVAADGQAEMLLLASSALTPELAKPLLALACPDAILGESPDPAATGVMTVQGLMECLHPPASRSSTHPTAWVLTTSGTTGTPKLVSHTLESLTRTTRRDSGKGRDQVWGLLYDHTRFAGLQVVLQSLLSGATLAVPDQRAPLADQLAFLMTAGVTHLSATPTLWRKILMTPGSEALPLRQITLGGEIADDAVLTLLSRRYPDARLSHIFASTEAGVGFSVTDRRAGFPVSYVSEPPAGIGLRIVDSRLQVRNEAVYPDYLGGQGTLATEGWVDTGDAVEIKDERVFFRGRANGVINVGGDKVHPEEVERALLSHPHVAMARVFAKSNPITGAVVAADIVPVPNAPETLRNDLRSYLQVRLERHMVPALIRITEPFDVNTAGKIRRS